MVQLYTIGFSKKSARTFFGLLRESGATGLVDVRLNNVSQLAGFAKRDDLKYFLKELCGMGYVHITDLAPTQPMLDELKKRKGDWATYEETFLALMRSAASSRPSIPSLWTTRSCCAARRGRTTAIGGWLPSISPSTGPTSRSLTSADQTGSRSPARLATARALSSARRTSWRGRLWRAGPDKMAT
jgi:hypothetical protein